MSSYLQDVLHEHFDEACFRLAQFEQALESPLRTLGDLARHPEENLLAHLDGLVIGGEAVQEELLVPALSAGGEDSAPVVVAAWALIEAGAFERLQTALEAAPEVWPQAAAAAHLAQHSGFEPWLTRMLSRRLALPTAGQAGLLQMAAARGMAAPPLLDALQSADPALAHAAATAASFSANDLDVPLLSQLLDHADGRVREAALIAGLGRNARQAWRTCEAWALAPRQPCPTATWLCAALGGRPQHARLAELRLVPEARRSVLFALGFSGNVELVGPLLHDLESADALERKLAFQSLALLAGFSPDDERLAQRPREPALPSLTLPAPESDPEARAALPALADDRDELVPEPEEALPEPNVAAVHDHCLAAQRRLSPQERILWGAPYHAKRVVDVLRNGPLRVRHGVALAFRLRAGPSYPTRRLSAQQQRGLTTLSEARAARFLEW